MANPADGWGTMGLAEVAAFLKAEGHSPEARNWLQVWRHLEGDVRRRQLGGSGRSRLQRVWEAGACHGQIA